MTKEYLIDHYGTLRYTIGTGCSGGSLAEQWIANAYPGVYQGIMPTCSFPDAWSTATQFLDYHQTLRYFQNPTLWGAGRGVDATADGRRRGRSRRRRERAGLRQRAVPRRDPDRSVRGDQRPAALRPDDQPGRGALHDPGRGDQRLRPAARSRLWTPQEKQIGHGFADTPVDNVGVQYGLGALQQGEITPAQFVDLNQKIGGLDPDANHTPERMRADHTALANAYRSGMINETNNLNRTAIIDCRGPNPGLFHDAYRAFAVRARLNRAHIPGTTKLHRLDENIGAAAVTLTDTDLSDIERAAGRIAVQRSSLPGANRAIEQPIEERLMQGAVLYAPGDVRFEDPGPNNHPAHRRGDPTGGNVRVRFRPVAVSRPTTDQRSDANGARILRLRRRSWQRGEIR